MNTVFFKINLSFSTTEPERYEDVIYNAISLILGSTLKTAMYNLKIFSSSDKLE